MAKEATCAGDKEEASKEEGEEEEEEEATVRRRGEEVEVDDVDVDCDDLSGTLGANVVFCSRCKTIERISVLVYTGLHKRRLFRSMMEGASPY